MKFVRRFEDSLWFLPALYALAAVAAVVVCWLIELVGLPFTVGVINRGVVSALLSIITTSMLTVTVFAVGSMVSAYSFTSQSGTPRVFHLIIADNATQNAASSFIGAFIFGVIATFAVRSGLFEGGDRAGLLALGLMTLGIFVWVIAVFIGWIDSIARLSHIDTSIHKAERASSEALDRAIAEPYLGGARLAGQRADHVVEVHPERFGYLTAIDMGGLERLAGSLDVSISVLARPGAVIDPSRPIATVDGLDRDAARARLLAASAGSDVPRDDADGDELVEDFVGSLRDAFDVSDQRSFRDDPEFGLTVLGEIAAKALSPAVNDPGTAQTVANAVTRQIADWHGRAVEPDQPEYPHVHVPALETHRLVKSGFDKIARYGMRDADVVAHLMSAFRYLSNTADETADGEIGRYAADVLSEARDHLTPREYFEIVAACPTAWTAEQTAT